MNDGHDLESLYIQARQALKAKDYDRASGLLKQILVIDENYKDASRLLAQSVKLKRRRWYNDPRLWGTLGAITVVGLFVWIIPRLSLGKTPASSAPTFSPTVTLTPTETASPSKTPTLVPTPIPLTWKRVSIGQELPRDVITAIVIDPGDPDVIYVGTEYAGIYKSIDGGISWRPLHNGLRHANIQSLLIDPLDPKILYAGASQHGIYKTTDGGEHWQAANQGIRRRYGSENGLLVMDPTNNQHLYFTTENTLYTSTDQGGSWILVKSGDTCPKQIFTPQSLVVHPLEGETLYAAQWVSSTGCAGGIYKSVDGGKTWALTGLQEDWIDLIFVEHNSQGDDFLFADQIGGENYPTHTSSDGGNTWQPSPQSCSALTIHPQGGVTAYCDRALVKTTDGGQTWETINKTNIGQVNAIAISSNNPAIIFIGGESLNVSTDGGGTWQERSNGLPAGRFDIKNNPRDSSTIYAFPWAVWRQNLISPLYRSGDSGQNWELLTEAGHGLLFDADGVTLYRYGEFLQRSRDNGLTWKALPLPKFWSEGNWGENRAFTNPIQEGMLYYIQDAGNIFLSTDSGTNWEDFSFLKTEWNLPRASISFDSEAKPLYLIPHYQAYRSPDGGRTWIQCPGDISWSSLSDTRLVIDPRDNNHILVAQLGEGVLGSRDGCDYWQSKNTGLGSLNINPLVPDPNNPDTVYAGTDGGAFVSFDFGETWNEINDGLLGATVVYSILVDKDSSVYAATPYGIFKLEGK